MTLPLSYSRPTPVVSGQLSVISFSLQMEADEPFPSMPPLTTDHRSLSTGFLELMTRIELVTSPLPRECSTN